MANLDGGVTEITLDGKTYTLKQSIKAALKVNRNFGSVGDALREVIKLNIDAMAYVIASGSGVGTVTDDFLARVWKESPRLIKPLTDYLLVMQNGGNPLPQEDQQDDAGNGEG